MYVKEYLSFVGGLYKIQSIKKRVDEMVELTGLGLEQGKVIGALSKGYRQRVGIAQALIHDPSVLILDEPTSGLDPNQLNEIRKLIVEVGKEKTVMLSTHIMQEVESVCDRVIIIDRGVLAANQSVAEIQKGTTNEQVVMVEFDTGIDIEELEKISGVDRVVPKSHSSFLLSSNGNQDIRPLIFQFAVGKGCSVLSMNLEKKSLEDVFKELTKS
jgi:ABC-2 type transport system ATP-binding protein